MAASDSDLVRRALGGSEDAYRRLMERYQRPVFALIYRMVREPGRTEDLSQEVFLKAFRALASFRLERKFSSWLFKIAHNTAIDHLRRSSPDEVALETPGEELDPLTRLPDRSSESPERAAMRGDLRRSFEDCLGRLRPAYREVVVLRFQEGLAYDEIAEVTGLPIGTVKTHIHRARRALAEEMRRLGWGPGTAAEPGETRRRPAS